MLFVFCLMLISCKDVTLDVPEEKNTSGITVLDSCWNLVPQESLSRAVGDLETVEEVVAEYNASNIDDQWFIYIGDYPDLADAPPCNVYFVDRVTHNIIQYDDGVGGFIVLKWENWSRAALVANKKLWKEDADRYQADLYIDVIPPAPIVVIPTEEELYIKYTLYVINSIGQIKFEEHCTETFVQADWPGYTVATFWAARLNAYNSEASSNMSDEYLPWRVISGQLYTE